MAKKITMFNHKEGVSKTTAIFNLGWMLAHKGHKVVLIDADPQCSLTGLVLGYNGDNFETFYTRKPEQNIKAGLAPAFKSQLKAIRAVECVSVKEADKLLLVPGHIGFAEYEVPLNIAQSSPGSIQTLQDIPGALSYFIDEIAEANEASYILIDMNPNLAQINQNVLITSNYFIVPTALDYLSRTAVTALPEVLPRWNALAEEAQRSFVLENATYPFPKHKSKFLGTVIQSRLPGNGNGAASTEDLQKWIDQINTLVSKKLVPVLMEKNMALSAEQYDRIGDDYKEGYCLSQLPDFNTLIAKSKEYHTPMLALDNKIIGHAEFYTLFNELADRVIRLSD